MKLGTKITVVCTAGVVVAAGAVAARSMLLRRRSAAPVPVERAAFPSADSMRADLRRAGFEVIGESEFRGGDERTWRTAVFHHPRAGDITLTMRGAAVHVLRVEALYMQSDRDSTVPTLLERWLPGILDVVDALQSAPYEGRAISVIGRRRFYMWLVLGKMNAASETQRMQLELRTPTGQELFVDGARGSPVTTTSGTVTPG